MTSAIQVERISKRYRIGLKETKSDTLGGAVVEFLRSPLHNLTKLRKLRNFEDESEEDTIWALRDVSFEVFSGEVVGIIGRNGAGKSTLLKILSRITEPTSGQATIYGRVSSLLEVGTGFHQDLTGRENVFLNGTILGMSKQEIESKFDQIVDFSEVEKFIDTPVKFFSSGMKVRLAFAVAAYLDPEVLLVDEVLAVGDVAFQRKCLGRMEDVAKVGRTILFVSHDMSAINRLCTRCVYLDRAQIAMIGPTHEVTAKYLHDSTSISKQYGGDTHSEDPVVLLSAKIHGEDSGHTNQIHLYEPFEVEMVWDRRQQISGAYYYVLFHDPMQRLIAADNTRHVPVDNETEGIHTIKMRVNPNRFAPGIYYVSFGCYKWLQGYLHHVMYGIELEVTNVTRGESKPFNIAGSPVMALDTQWTIFKLEPVSNEKT